MKIVVIGSTGTIGTAVVAPAKGDSSVYARRRTRLLAVFAAIALAAVFWLSV